MLLKQIMKGPLHLSRISDDNSSSSITISAQIVEALLPYEIDGVRFLYQQCILKKHNVILNCDKYMNNNARQISAILTSINKPFPTLIVCQSSSIPKWHYEFSKVNLNIVTPNELIKNVDDDDDDKTDLPDAVILSHEQIKHIKVLPITEWFFYIIEDIDLIIKSRFIKNIETQFRIAITTRNFVVDDDDSLQWNILKWANPNLIQNKDVFIETNIFNKKRLLYPFPEYWRRITWMLYEKYKPTNEQINQYDTLVNNWLKSINLEIPADSNNKRPSRKRKSTNNKSNINKRSIKKDNNIVMEETIKDIKIPKKSSDSETEEETDLLNSFIHLSKTKIHQNTNKEVLQNGEYTDSEDDNDFTFKIN